MSREEIADLLDLEDNYVRTHWTRIVASYNKRGYQLCKVGRGSSAEYGIKFPWSTDTYWTTDSLPEMYF